MFEPTRLAARHLADAYAQVVPPVVVKIVAVFFIHSVSLWPAHFIPQRWG